MCGFWQNVSLCPSLKTKQQQKQTEDFVCFGSLSGNKTIVLNYMIIDFEVLAFIN